MSKYENAMAVMEELFSKDCTFALATSNDTRPSVRMIDTYYENGSFYVVTYAGSDKVKDLEVNNKVALCSEGYRFEGSAFVIGHPLAPENSRIRETLIQIFEPWYFKHNNEKDEAMCYVKIDLESGFFYKDGTGYKVDYVNRTAEAFPFVFDIVLPED